jgi:asparagine synthase (glutamine-hydrolysing)
MCGFVGFLGGDFPEGKEGGEALLQRMADTISYRGPDDSGYWCDVVQRIGLGHRRLSILDLSSAGHQPMISPSGRYVIAFNGEVYNHFILRRELGAVSWRGHSDTETLLTSFDEWGIQGAVERVVGMFAFAVWDKSEDTLVLGRDRIGEKPLYYGWQGNSFLFGSELKALKQHPTFENNINRGALSLQLRHNCIPAPYSIYEGISKLLPGRLLKVSLQNRVPHEWAYWSGIEKTKSLVANSFIGNSDEAVDELEVLLKDSVRQQMMADVPLGAFLSGGIDSSIVVALMQAQSSLPVKTFTIGSYEKGYNEAVHAKEVAKHLGTDHTELYVTADQAKAVIPRLPVMYDEPFSDSSQIPTFLVSELARQHVTVSLSGDAGDELFCGYNRYQMADNLWKKVSIAPVFLRKLVAKALTNIPPQMWDRIANILKVLFSQSARSTNFADKLCKGSKLLISQSVDTLFFNLVSLWPDPESVVVKGLEPPTLLVGNAPNLKGLDDVQRMMALDMLTYLPDDILVKVDRAAMNVSLETRMPFLDHRVVEFAWTLPQSMKLHNGITKWLLRQVLYRYVPKKLIERPKMGFDVPISPWLIGPLREWAEELLNESRLRQEGYFYPAPIRQKWNEHLSGQRNWAPHLWSVLMFQGWLESQ